MGNVRNRIDSFQKQGMEIFYSATFITGKEKVKLVDHAPASLLSLVSKNLKYEKPDKIRIELFNGKEADITIWPKEFVCKEEGSEPEKGISTFRGFGEVEINRIVDERFRERKQQVEFEELKEQVQELTEENEELQDTLEKLETRNTQLEQELEGKKQIKYYAGMLGDIFESFGISKDRIKKPIAELMGITDSNEKSKQQESEIQATDNSGIIEETVKPSTPSAEEQKRTEIISLIAEYLRTTSNQTLAHIFSIFSEIEADNSIADKIIQYINTLKTQDHANV